MKDAISLGAVERVDVNAVTPVLTQPKSASWRAVITSDTDLHIAVGTNPVADTSSMYVPKTARPPLTLKIGAGDRLSILGVGAGSAWIAHSR